MYLCLTGLIVRFNVRSCRDSIYMAKKIPSFQYVLMWRQLVSQKTVVY